jgi:hypothetical protein
MKSIYDFEELSECETEDEAGYDGGWEPLGTNDAEELRSYGLRMIESLCVEIK